MLEIAARPIGGLCSRVLKFENGETLEDILLRHAIGDDVSAARRVPGGHAVMMIPIPRAGVFQGVRGLDRALLVEGIEAIEITAKQGQMLLPLPEGASYLGFIFACADAPESAQAALRAAHACLEFEMTVSLPVI
jgi:hypothetical protein